jgi:hypothetical protein
MPLSIDPETLGLSEEDLRDAGETDDAEQEKRHRARRAVVLDGVEFDPTGDDLRRLITAAQSSVTGDFLASRPAVAKLDAVAVARRGGNGGGGGAGRAGRRDKLAPDQKIAIGLVGEALAYEWLSHVYAETTADSWVSTNRSVVLGGHEGNDFLGYDFEVVRRSQTLLFEVKATAGEGFEFDFGESELRAAKSARRGQYRIVFLRSVLSTAERELLVLPNPLEVGSADLFAQVNDGVRLRFQGS